MIFVTGTTGRTCGEKICHVEKIQISPHLSCGEIRNVSTSIMWRKLRFIHMTDVENWSCLHMMDVEQFHISPHDRCWEYELSPHNRWGEFHHLLIYQINNVYNLRCFYVYYAVLLQNLFILRFTLFCLKIRFCRDLCAFAWRKIEPKIVTVEKKGQISCMHWPWLFYSKTLIVQQRQILLSCASTFACYT